MKGLLILLTLLFFAAKGHTQATIAVDVFPGFDCLAPGEPCGVYPSELTLFQGKIIFAGANPDGINGERVLWEFDGSIATPVAMPHEYVINLAVFDSILLFRGSISNNYEPWKYNGNSVELLADLNPVIGSNPEWFFEYKDKIYFRAYNADSSGLWVYDPANDIQPVSDALPGGLCSWSSFFINFNDTLYFSAMGGSAVGTELWKTDGASPPEIAVDMVPGSNSSNLTPLIVFQGKLICVGNSVTEQSKTWEYDGVNFPVQIANFNGQSWQPEDMFIFNDELYFVGNDWVHNRELVKYDGTNSPSIVADINPNGDADIFDIIEYNGFLFFGANDGVHGKELWRYDGVNPPELFQDINPGGSGSGPNDFVIYNNDLYFSAYDSLHGSEIWVLRQDASLKEYQQSQLSLYPNPTSGKISIQHPNQLNPSFIQVYTASGVCIETYTNVSELDISNLVSGVYFIELHYEDQSYFERIVKM